MKVSTTGMGTMDFGLTGEQQMIVETVRSFVEKEIYPHEAEVERSGHVTLDLGSPMVTHKAASTICSRGTPRRQAKVNVMSG